MATGQKTAVAIVAGFLITGFGAAQEKKITRSDLPPAVEMKVAEVSKDATIKGFTEEQNNGNMSYEIEMIVKGHTKDVEMDGAGSVVEVEEEIAMDSLPADVKSGLTAKASGGKIVKVESITKKGKVVAYEANVETSGKHSEIQVGPDGKSLDHTE